VEPPVGTIAMLFTDVEGSTRLATKLGSSWPAVLADHHDIVAGAIEAEGGWVDGTEGDAFFATFADAAAAARAATAALRALRAHPWPDEVGELMVRMGLHVGYVERHVTGYAGLEVHRAARVGAAAHGGQLLLTASARDLIADAVATEPLGTHRLKDFPTAQPLYCAVVDDRGAAAFPPPRAWAARETNLPAGLPNLVGREHDLERIRTLVAEDRERLVTLTGRGGAGKSSLALAAATALLDEHPGGVWLARLAPVTEPRQLLATVAAAIGAEGDLDSSPLEAIRARLAHRGPTLLVLDNLEHLLAAGPDISRLLDALPGLRLIVTSQVPLRLGSEYTVVLDALDDESALQLMARVGRRRGVTVSTSGPDRAPLLDLVRLLDGLPLALELAAARLSLMRPDQLRDRLTGSVELLRDDRPDRPERQRSLRATLEWTLELLDERARMLFTRLGVFAGPVELEQIEAIVGGEGVDVLKDLPPLLDTAIVRRVESGDGRIRLGLPEALRQLASQRLDGAPDGALWRRAHARRVEEVMWRVRGLLVSNGVYSAAVAAQPEAAAALRWADSAGDPLAETLAAGWATLLVDQGQIRRALGLLQPLLDAPPSRTDVHAQALTAYSVAMAGLDRSEVAIASAQQAVAIATDPLSQALAIGMRGTVRLFGQEKEPALADSQAATELARELDPALHAGLMCFEAQALAFNGQLQRGAERHAEAERLGRAADLQLLGRQDTVRGDRAMLSGQPLVALEYYARSLESAHAAGLNQQVMFDLLGIALALASVGADEDALELTGIGQALMAELAGPGASAAAHLLGDDELMAAQRRLGEDAVQRARRRGRDVPAATRVERACSLARAAAAIST
jgi:predicted ATPase/class 3 adenylate cyclase